MSDSPLDLGSRLRAARHQRGYSLHYIATVTKIPLIWLYAIERNNFDRLPGGLFGRAYVRAFAAEVGVDPDPLPDVLMADDAVVLDSGAKRRGENGWRHMPTVLAILLLLAALALLRVV
jgi:cytoskeletal protein RodZ